MGLSKTRNVALKLRHSCQQLQMSAKSVFSSGSWQAYVERQTPFNYRAAGCWWDTWQVEQTSSGGDQHHN